jgi:nucleoside-diphosphate-sugar epimerase
MRIVTFGAGGFVGGWICEELSQRDDIEQVACVRKWASAVRLARRGIAIRQIDLEDVNDISAVLAGADAVVNAAMPPASREPELVMALYSACVRAGVRRFVQFSSAAVYGSLTGIIDEGVSPAPTDDYSWGKAKMEKRLAEAAQTSPTQVVILRPSIVYGPFSEGWTVRYVDRIIKGRWRSLGRAGEGTCNLIHAQDAARAAIAAATGNIPPGTHVLNINGPDVVSWNEYIERLGDALGQPGRSVPNIAQFRTMAATAKLLRMGSGLTWLRTFYRRSKGSTRAVMTNAKGVTDLYPASTELDLLSRQVQYRANQATKTLGVSPSISLEQGLRQSVAWCRLHGII